MPTNPQTSRAENISGNPQTAYLITNHELAVIEASEQVRLWLGPSMQNLIGELLTSFIPELAIQEANLRQVALGQKPTFKLSRIHRPTDNGFDNYFNIQFEALKSKPQHLLVMITNVTYFTQLEQGLLQNHNQLSTGKSASDPQCLNQLEESNRELQRQNKELLKFVSIVSHDLQSPLRTVINFLNLLSEKYSDQLDETANVYIDYVVSGAGRMQTLIRDLLIYVRLQIKSQPWPTIAVETLLERVRDGFGSHIHIHDATINYNNLPEIKADPDLMYQLFQQIIDNALKFQADKPSQIQVTAKRTDHVLGWQISIQDNGIGFDPKFAQEIFQVFRQLHPADTYPGTGIGLALCQKIVTLHGGQIWADSTPEQGTSIHLILPDAVD